MLRRFISEAHDCATGWVLEGCRLTKPTKPTKLDQVPVLFCLQHTNVCVYTLLTQGLVFGVISTNHQGGLDLQRQAITSDLDAQRRDQNLLRVAAECQLTRHSLGCRKSLEG